MPETVSNRWLPAIRGGFTPVTKVDVIFPGEGTVYENLPVEKGSVSVDWVGGHSNGTITVPDPTLFPALYSESPIGPYGAELVIKTGIRYGEHEEELVQMGIFPIWSADGTEKGGGITTLKFYDRGKLIAGTHFVQAQDFGGWLVQDAITEALTYAAPFYPGTGVEWEVDFDPALTNPRLPGGVVGNEDRWQFAKKLAQRIGAIIYFGRDGNAKVVPTPGVNASTPLSAAVYRIDGDTMIDATRSISRDNIYNGVVVRGSTKEGTGSQPFYEATDINPNSKTMWGGPFGKHSLTIDMAELTTNAQCEVAAKAELRNRTGQQANITFNAVGDPALNPHDIILVEYPSSGQQELHMLATYAYDFYTAAMNGETKSVNYIS